MNMRIWIWENEYENMNMRIWIWDYEYDNSNMNMTINMNMNMNVNMYMNMNMKKIIKDLTKEVIVPHLLRSRAIYFREKITILKNFSSNSDYFAKNHWTEKITVIKITIFVIFWQNYLTNIITKFDFFEEGVFLLVIFLFSDFFTKYHYLIKKNLE